MLTIKKLYSKIQSRTSTIYELKLKPEHGFFIACGSLLALEFLWIEKCREKAREETFEKNIAIIYKNYYKTHYSHFNANLSVKGFPDDGNNKYSEFLKYKDWLKIAGPETAKNKFIDEICIFFNKINRQSIIYTMFSSMLYKE